MRPKKIAPASLPKLFDVVELVAAHPDAGVAAGTLGTIVEELAEETYLVEFCNAEGRTIAVEPVPARDLALHR